ncbi:Zinc finger, CCHC-type [Sesbania bispinosa]|nr:Zinc finger, CCHC-type [Sesbania bispinosa]
MEIEDSLEGAEIQLDTEAEAGLTLARKTLVGRILTDKSLNRVAVKEILAKAWGLNEDINISDMGPNIFLFHFKEGKQAKKVLEEGPWYVMSQLVSLQFGFQKLQYLRLIGEVVLVENPMVDGQLLRLFMRIRVQVNVKKPLITGFWLPRKDLPKTWIFIKYERLQGFCYNCGIIGHDNRKCKKEKEMVVYNTSRPRFGPNLGVPQARSLATIVTENTRRKNKNKEAEGSEVPRKTNQDSPRTGDNNGLKGTPPRVMGPTRNPPSPNSVDSTTQNKNVEVGMTGSASEMGPDQIEGVSKPTDQEENTVSDPNQPNPIFSHNRPNSGKKPFPVTLVDVFQEQVRPGLGPQQLEFLAIQPEDIGLNEPVIILDYPSPHKHGSSHYGVQLAGEDIQKCRDSWLLKADNQGALFSPKLPTNSGREIPTGSQSSSSPLYYVEFPPEGDEIVPCQENPKTVSQLIEGFYNKVFRDFVNDSGLMDIDLKGSTFTWFSNPRNGIVTKEKIDRVLANSAWRLKFPNALAMAFPVVSSDHTPILFEALPQEHSGRQFKYEVMWDEHPDWKEIPKLKARLVQLQNTKITEESLEDVKSIKSQITRLWKQEEFYWGQRSRLKWLKWGDKNTKFFHATTIQRRSRNRLERNKDGQGRWVVGQKDVMEAAVNHFRGVFTSERTSQLEECLSDIPILVSSELNQRLMAEVTDTEIKTAVNSLGSTKAPGPDGLNGLFYKSHWASIGEDICRAVRFHISLAANILWAIWKQRNNLVFRYQEPQPIPTLIQAYALLSEFLQPNSDP